MDENYADRVKLSPEKRKLLDFLLREEGLAPSWLPMEPRGKVSHPLPLSFAQQRMWFLNQLNPGNAAYNISLALRFRGALDVSLLARTLDEIVRRHESLRTAFEVLDGQPVQIISPAGTLSLSLVDVCRLPGYLCEVEIRRLISQEAERPFDLIGDSLLRTTLLRLTPLEHIFLLTFHHIACDGWSVGVFFHELAVLYTSLVHGEPSPLPDLPIQYADFALWQREGLQREGFDAQLAYWCERLKDLPILDLPTDHPRPPVQAFQGASTSFLLPRALSEDLQHLSQREGVTLFMLLLAVFLILLFRYSGQEDFAVGSPIANRTYHPELENLIGFFVNTLVLRANLSGTLPFRDLLSRVRQLTLEAYANQDLPFEYLVEAIAPERTLGRPPLFQVLFVLQNTPRSDWKLADLIAEPLNVESGTAMFDLALMMVEGPYGLEGTLQYYTALFEKATIQRLAKHYQTLLEGIVAHPEQRLADLPLLTEAEQQHLLFDWNATHSDSSGGRWVYELFEEQVERTPEAIAVSWEQLHLSYCELNQQANLLAGQLRHYGVGPEIRVGVYLPRSADLLIALLAILKAGGTYLPLDPSSPPQRLGFMLTDAHVPILLSYQRLLTSLPAHEAQVICLDAVAGIVRSLKVTNEVNLVSRPAASNLAYVIYTSGSTGQPKGTMLSQQGWCNLAAAQWRIFQRSPGDRVLQAASLNFDASIWEITMAFTVGATLCLPSQDVLLPGSAFLEFLQEQAITALTLAPSLLTLLPEADLPHLQILIAAGEMCPAHLVARWAPGRQFYNAYGPTEATVCATVSSCQPEGGQPDIGRPIQNTHVYVLDACSRIVPVGVVGELYLGGEGLARGYLQRADLTAERFIPHPFSKEGGERLYKTGDLAYWCANGKLTLVGRRDRQVKLRGYRIELGEIEAVLRAHEGVREAVALLLEEERNEKRLVTYVVPHQRQQFMVSDLRDYTQRHLPGYMVPTTFILLETLPLTSSGKVDHHALPTPAEIGFNPQENIVPPRDPLELQLVQLWEDLLHVHPIGVRDDFFTLGGHSLLVIRLVEQIQKRFGQRLPPSIFFQNGSVEHLAAILRHPDLPLLRAPLVEIQPRGSKPRFFCVHPAGGGVLGYYRLACHLDPDQPFYGFQDPTVYDEEITPLSIEYMATTYLAALRANQPAGPYYLGGYSFGGIVAFEMARQLQQQGHQVGLLAIFDGATPALSESLADADDATFLAVIAHESTRRASGRTLQKWYDALCHLSSDAQLNYVLAELRLANVSLPQANALWLRRQVSLFKSRVQAVHTYVPQLYSGHITLFLSYEKEELERSKYFGEMAEQPVDYGWGELSTQAVEIHFIPGYHDTMIAEPQVQILARQLQSCLDKQAFTSQSI